MSLEARRCCFRAEQPSPISSAIPISVMKASRSTEAAVCWAFPIPIIIMVGMALVAAYVAMRTPFGRRVYAVGGNERAAGLSGVRVDRVKISVYMISGFCAAVAGLIVSSQLVASHPASGETFELNAIAAAVLGGTSLSGGRGTIGGTIIGAFVIGVLGDGLVMMGVSEFWQMVMKGLVIIAAVVLDQLQRRVAPRRGAPDRKGLEPAWLRKRLGGGK